MSQSRENVANNGSPRHARTRSSSEGGSSFQFPFFDQTPCEFMTPPPTNGRQGTRKAASVNGDDEMMYQSWLNSSKSVEYAFCAT